MKLPKDPVILVSYLNTQLRDFYPSLEAFCEANEADAEAICEALADYDYIYSKTLNRFL